ncbi:DUF885 domain-containing protein [Tessaracoccus caeni]|uniref:DUF885 domain-containing protein n=1 Tax=Tessaracoccus caeni TaxID=3031239 RepID=UPI0023DC55D9|nr:DUF885 domain-containing protein [Tessaracoccus caeni]MDF1488137.1 DUF885 domain-containing protein [Tessaracoccus caeni]
MTDARPATALDAIADSYTEELARLSPIQATDMGIPGHDHRLDDFSPDGHAARTELARRTLAAVEAAPIVDEVDRITQLAMRERLGLEIELVEAGEHLADLNVVASPLQSIRDVFELMPTSTVEDWEGIATRMSGVGEAIDGYVASLGEAFRTGPAPARRQVELGIAEAAEMASDNSFWQALIESAYTDDGPVPPALVADLETAAGGARAAYARLSKALRGHASKAPVEDAVGRERYQLLSRRFLGDTIDLDETYEWGIQDLARIVDEQQALAGELFGPGTGVEEAMELLDEDPARQLLGTDALQQWIQATADEAVQALSSYIDIPEPARTLECVVFPTHSGGVYYHSPSDDFSRPGRLWWSVPPDVDTFGTWRVRTTVYHEGAPGHHLQLSTTIHQSRTLNMWRRLACWVSGHGEGWALYAERLMQELGFLDDPGDRMGLLDSQRLRAARVVLDIGLHLGKEHPLGGTWNADNARDFLTSNSTLSDGFRQFELDRYLGWPGEAPSYKVGQRIWEGLRRDAERRQGPAFDLSAFHRHALELGSVPLSVLREALAGHI